MTVSLTSLGGNGVERRQAKRLRRSRALATGLLALAGASFAATLMIHNPGPALLLLRAVAEAALVGGLADWFAVTALFRRPLGLPIPHTAILPANKERIGEGLARFIQENFLNAEVLAERIRSARLVPRLAAWLSDRANAARFAGHAADLVVTVAESMRDEDV